MGTVELLREQLGLREQNLAKLELQAARHGMDVPLALQNQIDFEIQKIEELRRQLTEAEAGPSAAEEEAAALLWQKVPMWGWAGIGGIVLLIAVAVAYLAGLGAKPVPTPTMVARVATPTATSAAMPQPTATPIAPTSTPVPPTATPVPTSTPRPTATSVLTYYDDNFNDPAFDGTYNTGLWSRMEGAVEQRDGVLVVSHISGLWESIAGLSTEKYSNWLLPDLGYVEAKLMLDSNLEGEYANSHVLIRSNDTNWWLNCRIVMCKTGRFCTYEWDRPWMACNSPDQYDSDGIEVEYNMWHTARVEVDPETVTFHIYLDGSYLDSFTPPNATALKDDSFHVEVGVYLEPNSSATGYIDDVRIGK